MAGTEAPKGLTPREAELLAALVTARRMLNKNRKMLPPGLFDREGMKQVNRAIGNAKAGGA